MNGMNFLASGSEICEFLSEAALKFVRSLCNWFPENLLCASPLQGGR